MAVAVSVAASMLAWFEQIRTGSCLKKKVGEGTKDRAPIVDAVQTGGGGANGRFQRVQESEGLHMLDMIRTPAMGIAKNYRGDHIGKVLHFHSMSYGPEHGIDALDVVCPLAWLKPVPVR